MSILFSDIYTKAIALFDDPKITKAYQTNKIQFDKLMWTYLQNAIALFTNPSSIGVRLANFNEPKGIMQTFEVSEIKNINEDGSVEFDLDTEFEILDNSLYTFIEGEVEVQGKIDKENHTVIFPHTIPNGMQYAIEQYYIGEFLDEFNGLHNSTSIGNQLIINEIKDILARLLVKSWGEGERNMLLDIRNIMQDSDFKITGNDRILKSKNEWIDQLDTEILQLQNKLAWNIRFMKGSTYVGIGRG